MGTKWVQIRVCSDNAARGSETLSVSADSGHQLDPPRLGFARYQRVDQPRPLRGPSDESSAFDVDPADLVIARRARNQITRIERPRRRACDVAAEIDRLSGRVFVFVDQAAEQVGAVELRIGRRSQQFRVSVCPLGWTKCECPMRPMLIVMAGIDAKYVLEVAAAEYEQPVEALATDAANPALGVSVRVWCLDGRADHGNPLALEDVIAAATELGVAIMDEEAERLLAIIESHEQVARLLGDPGARWVRRAAKNSTRRLSSEMKKST